MFSGCQDSQTSADVHDVSQFGLPEVDGPSNAGGACTNSLLKVLKEESATTWIEVLKEMRAVLKKKRYTQIPQLSCSRMQDLSGDFNVAQGDGRKKAVLIGINYEGQRGELKGCINDVKAMKRYLESQDYEDFKILTDDEDEKPTRENIMEALHWLITGAESGDNLFLHYSGHGGQMKDQDGDEKDGVDETMVPLDYTSAGQIRDDDLFKALIAPLKEGVNLSVIMDCCHSGSILDLPFMIKGDDAAMEAVEAGDIPAMQPNPGFNLQKIIKIATHCFQVYQQTRDIKSVGAAAFSEVMSEGGFQSLKFW